MLFNVHIIVNYADMHILSFAIKYHRENVSLTKSEGKQSCDTVPVTIRYLFKKPAYNNKEISFFK